MHTFRNHDTMTTKKSDTLASVLKSGTISNGINQYLTAVDAVNFRKTCSEIRQTMKENVMPKTPEGMMTAYVDYENKTYGSNAFMVLNDSVPTIAGNECVRGFREMAKKEGCALDYITKNNMFTYELWRTPEDGEFLSYNYFNRDNLSDNKRSQAEDLRDPFAGNESSGPPGHGNLICITNDFEPMCSETNNNFNTLYEVDEEIRMNEYGAIATPEIVPMLDRRYQKYIDMHNSVMYGDDDEEAGDEDGEEDEADEEDDDEEEEDDDEDDEEDDDEEEEDEEEEEDDEDEEEAVHINDEAEQAGDINDEAGEEIILNTPTNPPTHAFNNLDVTVTKDFYKSRIRMYNQSMPRKSFWMIRMIGKRYTADFRSDMYLGHMSASLRRGIPDDTLRGKTRVPEVWDTWKFRTLVTRITHFIQISPSVTFVINSNGYLKKISKEWPVGETALTIQENAELIKSMLERWAVIKCDAFDLDMHARKMKKEQDWLARGM